MSSNRADTTRFLQANARGDAKAADRLLPLVYQDLRALAASYLKGSGRDTRFGDPSLAQGADLV